MYHLYPLPTSAAAVNKPSVYRPRIYRINQEPGTAEAPPPSPDPLHEVEVLCTVLYEKRRANWFTFVNRAALLVHEF